MTICRNYVSGVPSSCNFGSRCKFQHIDSPNKQSIVNSRNRFSTLSHHSSTTTPSTTAATTTAKEQNSDLQPNKDLIMKDFTYDRPIWLFSSYGHAKDQPSIIKEDWSPEECRLAYYQSKLSNNIEPYLLECNQREIRMNSEMQRVLADPIKAFKSASTESKMVDLNNFSLSNSSTYLNQIPANTSSLFNHASSSNNGHQITHQNNPSIHHQQLNNATFHTDTRFGSSSFGHQSNQQNTSSLSSNGFGQGFHLNTMSSFGSTHQQSLNPFISSHQATTSFESSLHSRTESCPVNRVSTLLQPHSIITSSQPDPAAQSMLQEEDIYHYKQSIFIFGKIPETEPPLYLR